MIHDPLTELKRSSYEKESREITNDAVKRLFNLPEEEKEI